MAIENYVQTINSMNLYAQRAVCDKDGNDISTTYQKAGEGSMTSLFTPEQTASLINTGSLPSSLVWFNYDGSTMFPLATFTRGNGVRRIFVAIELDSSDLGGMVEFTLNFNFKARHAGTDITNLYPVNYMYSANHDKVLCSGTTVIICKEIPLYIPETLSDYNQNILSVDDVIIDQVDITFYTEEGGSAPTTLNSSSLAAWII